VTTPRKARRSNTPLWLAASSRRDGAGRPAGRTYTNGASVWTTIYQLGQRELLTASACRRPLNPRHVRDVHRCDGADAACSLTAPPTQTSTPVPTRTSKRRASGGNAGLRFRLPPCTARRVVHRHADLGNLNDREGEPSGSGLDHDRPTFGDATRREVGDIDVRHVLLTHRLTHGERRGIGKKGYPALQRASVSLRCGGRRIVGRTASEEEESDSKRQQPPPPRTSL
jgi:hypothetical protein